MIKSNDIRYLYDINSGVELIFCHNSTISYPLHNHVSVFAIGMVLDGAILLRHAGGSHVYHKDQIFSVFPYMPHSIMANNRYTLVSLCFHKDSFPCLPCDSEKLKADILNLLKDALGFHSINQRQMVKLAEFLSAYLDGAFSFRLYGKDPLIDDLRQQLEQYPENKLSIEEMAHSALISKYYFIRSFQQNVGLTPHQFQLQNRIRKAQRMLLKAGTITEVALTTGFCDQSHFIKQFEKFVGLTPTAYKMSSGVYKPESKV